MSHFCGSRMAAQRNWLPDDASKGCVGCSKAFSFSRRKHHCRACGRLFCNGCSDKKVELPHMGLKGPQRGIIIINYIQTMSNIQYYNISVYINK